jgi:membrane protein
MSAVHKAKAIVARLLETRFVHWARKSIDAMDRSNVLGLASEMAYNFIFALFPFLISIVALLAYFPVGGLLDQLLYEIKKFVPGPGYDLIAGHLTELASNRRSGLLSFGFVVAIWSASSALTGLVTGLNQVYGAEDRRSFFKVRGMAIGLTLAAGLLSLLGLVLVVFGGSAGDWLSRQLGRPDLYSTAWTLLRWPAAMAILVAILIVLYLVCPDVKLRVHDVLPGALLAAGAWVLTTLGFSFYITHFTNFGVTYGSLGTAIVLLTWLYLNGLFVIGGGQANALIAEARGTLPPRREAPKVQGIP